ncbi:MAG: hypothetical protein ACLQU2_06775 [Candidatus Binataceae bacterium]
MSERLQVVVITVAVFVLGLSVGVWTQRMRPMPPPPIPLMGEFRPPPMRRFGPPVPPPPPMPWMLGFGPGPSISARQMRARIEALQPEIEAFRHNVDVIEDQFRRKLDAVLTPEQRDKLSALRSSMPQPPPPPMPGCAGEVGDLFVPMVIYRPTLDRISEVLSLTDPQREQLKTLLIDRRQQLLTLLDQTPPPSFKLVGILQQSVDEPGDDSP